MINKEALELIKKYEGLRLRAYPDPGSKNGLPWTIGYGHTKDVKKGDVITEAVAEKYLIDDLKVAEGVIAKHVAVKLNENQYGALVSFIHNVGERQFADGSVKKYINNGNLSAVPNRMKLYNKNDGKVLQGLVNRREAESELWNKPVGTIAQPVKVKDNWLLVLIKFILSLFKGK